MKKITKICLFVFALVITSYFGYKYAINQGSRDLNTESAKYTTTSLKLFDEFQSNSETATTKYLNQAIEVKGNVTSLNINLIILDGKISCQLQNDETPKLNSSITIKGRVTGYDDLLEEVKLDQCLILK